MPRTQDLKALRGMIAEAKNLLETSPELPQVRTARALKLLGDSLALADRLLTVEPAQVPPRLSANTTAKRSAEYFRLIAAMRKTKAGGRPRKLE